MTANGSTIWCAPAPMHQRESQQHARGRDRDSPGDRPQVSRRSFGSGFPPFPPVNFRADAPRQPFPKLRLAFWRGHRLQEFLHDFHGGSAESVAFSQLRLLSIVRRYDSPFAMSPLYVSVRATAASQHGSAT